MRSEPYWLETDSYAFPLAVHYLDVSQESYDFFGAGCFSWHFHHSFVSYYHDFPLQTIGTFFGGQINRKKENKNVQIVVEQKKRGCLMSCLWILFAICTLAAVIWIPLLIKQGSKTRAHAV